MTGYSPFGVRAQGKPYGQETFSVFRNARVKGMVNTVFVRLQ